MKKLLLVLSLLVLIPRGLAAQTITNNITVSGATCPNGGNQDTNCVTLGVPSDGGTLVFSVTGTWTGTISFEYKTNNSAYAALTMVNTTSLAAVTGTTANGNWVVNNAGYTFIRMRASATITGTAVAVIKVTNSTSVVGIIFGGGGSTIGTVNQGTAGVDPWAVTCISGCSGTTLGQATMANSLPVAIASNQSAVPVNQSQINGSTTTVAAGGVTANTQRVIEANDSTLTTNTTTIAGIVSSARAAVNPISGQAGVAAGTGSISALTQRVTLATDDPLVLAAQATSTPFLAAGLDDTPQTVDSNAGVLDSYYCYNPNDEVSYVQFLDATSPSLGTTVPKWSIGIPPASAGNLSNMNLAFANAIKVAATTTYGGSTAPDVDLNCNFGSH